MTKKERVKHAILHQKSDRLPHQIDFTWRMKKEFLKHFQIHENELPELLGNHFLYMDTHKKVKLDEEKGVDYDIFGVGWDLIKSEGYLPCFHPLTDWKSFSTFQFPDPQNPILYQDFIPLQEWQKKEYFILSTQGWVLMERAWLLRGFENFMIDLIDNRTELERLLDLITEYQIEVLRHLIRLGVDGIYTGDDYGTQRGLLIARKTWQNLFKPRLKRIWNVAKKEGIPVFHHSCGNVLEILDDMIEIGLNVLIPVQPQAMDIQLLQNRFGNHLTFMGGISTQKTLPFGTPTDVQLEVRKCIEVLGSKNNYIISASHEIGSDCPMDNLIAFFNEMKLTNGSDIPLLDKQKT
ncbi:MAG: hypothetical protein GX432_10120 [Candidatus Atribacteria bacterium]|nr:hypothetical protein [Candidatus Atribacteria bacterium]